MPRIRIIAALELLLVSPAALFMTALVVRNLRPLPNEPAHIAQRIVSWYSGQMWTLWVLLLALPFAVLVIGCATLRGWNRSLKRTNSPRQSIAMFPSNPKALLIAATTLTAAGILMIVVLHMLAN